MSFEEMGKQALGCGEMVTSVGVSCGPKVKQGSCLNVGLEVRRTFQERGGYLRVISCEFS